MRRLELEYPVKTMSRVLNVSRAGYYRWKDRSPSGRAEANARLVERIREIHIKSRETYGSPRVTQALHHEKRACSENRIARLMSVHHIRAKAKRKFRREVTSTIVRYPAVANAVNQLLKANAPNRLWVADMTFIRTREGWLYLAAILDVYSRRIVGWSVGPEPTAALAQRAMETAIGRRPVNPGLVHHSDQGAQYANHKYQGFLQAQGVVASMSRRGNCYDNAMIESFFHTLKMEHVYWQSYRNRREAETSIFDYIELFYNPDRLHSGLDYRSPAQYEKLT